MKSKYVYSTLSNSFNFTRYAETRNSGEIPREIASVIIHGGAGVINKHFHTPRGVATKVTEDELETLKAVPLFLSFVKDGFITIGESGNADKIGEQMGTKDSFAQLTPNDFKDPPKVRLNGIHH